MHSGETWLHTSSALSWSETWLQRSLPDVDVNVNIDVRCDGLLCLQTPRPLLVVMVLRASDASRPDSCVEGRSVCPCWNTDTCLSTHALVLLSLSFKSLLVCPRCCYVWKLRAYVAAHMNCQIASTHGSPCPVLCVVLWATHSPGPPTLCSGLALCLLLAGSCTDGSLHCLPHSFLVLATNEKGDEMPRLMQG